MLAKYLCELNIEEIPSPWESACKDTCPNEETQKFIFIKDSFFTNLYEFNPMKCRKFLIAKFNELRNEAKQLLNAVSPENITIINRLISIDIMLYNILCFWLSDDMDSTDYDLKQITIGITTDITSYFDTDTSILPDYIEQIKLIKLDLTLNLDNQ